MTEESRYDGYGIFAQRFDALGTPVAGEFQVNTYTTGDQAFPRLSIGRSGDFLVAWQSGPHDELGSEIRGRAFDDLGSGLGPDFLVNTYTTGGQIWASVAASSNDTFAVSWLTFDTDADNGVRARFRYPLVPTRLQVDPPVGQGSLSNGILEPDEAALIVPEWNNTGVEARSYAGSALSFGGPTVSGTTYNLADPTADYGSIEVGTPADCLTATLNCYLVSVAGPRPTPHWDATLVERISSTAENPWSLHIGQSFTDVPKTHPFYRFVENLFHNEVTTGCANGLYCPAHAVTRAQMSVFLLRGKHGADFVPPPCQGFFTDVDCPGPYTDWVEQLAAEGITAGCGVGIFCPNTSVNRQQMAVFLLKAKHGSNYTPPGCQHVFADVACPSLFADWVEQLAAENITGGCGGGNFCPLSTTNRGQMAVFLVKTFGLQLYGP